MVQLSKPLSTALSIFVLIALTLEPLPALCAPQQPIPEQTQKEPGKSAKKSTKEKKKRARKDDAEHAGQDEAEPNTDRELTSETVEIVADAQSRTGDLLVYEGYVNATV